MDDVLFQVNLISASFFGKGFFELGEDILRSLLRNFYELRAFELYPFLRRQVRTR